MRSDHPEGVYLEDEDGTRRSRIVGVSGGRGKLEEDYDDQKD